MLTNYANEGETKVIKTKIPLGFAIATCVLAFLATPALAGQWKSASGKYPVKFRAKATSTHTFTVAGGVAVECERAEFQGELVAETRSLQVRPTYTKCKTTIAGVKHEAEVKTTGCEYRLTINKPQTSPPTGLAKVSCTGSNLITITVKGTTCVITVGEAGNTSLKKFKAENVGTKGVNIQAEVEGISYVAKKCGIAENGTEGKYTGRVEGEGVIVR